MSKRRRAREIVLQALYEAEFSDGATDEVLDRQIERRAATEETAGHARALFARTYSHREELDAIIVAHLENWEMERIALVDKNILRFAIAELLYFPEVPARVIMNEAIEIAHRYSSDDAGRFINGLLDRCVKKYREETA